MTKDSSLEDKNYFTKSIKEWLYLEILKNDLKTFQKIDIICSQNIKSKKNNRVKVKPINNQGDT